MSKNKLVCPSCNQAHELAEYINATDADMAFKIALSVPFELSDLVMQYTELFKPAKQALTLDRRAKVIETMHLEGCDVERMAYGLRAVLERHEKDPLETPLKINHGYLKGCIKRFKPADEQEKQKYTLTDKQIKFFGYRLCQNENFAMKYAHQGESQGDFWMRIEHELRNPENVKKWYGYIEVISQKANQNLN